MGLFEKKAPCYETNCIMEYVDARLHGLETVKPTVEYGIHQNILNQFEKLLNNEAVLAGISSELLAATARLSNFDVEMSFVAEEIKGFAGEMSSASQMNMAMVEQITASMDHVNEAITSHSGTLQRITQQSQELIQTNNNSMQEMNSINSLKEEVIQDAHQMSVKIETLVDMVQKVNQIVLGVKSIAEQTNLLALNASIEAARAGEHGKGFAVVAEEIRRMADDTKKNLEGMQDFMNSIHAAANEGKASMNNTLSSTMKMSEKIEAVSSSITENVLQLKDTVDGIQDISQGMHEIASSADEINTAMKSAAAESEHLSVMTEQILEQARTTANSAKVIADIDTDFSNLTKELNRLLVGGIHAMSNEKFMEHIEMAKKNHGIWMDKLKNIINTRQLVPLQTNSQKCAFGHFYHLIEVNHPAIATEWAQIDEFHDQLHKQGGIAMNAIKENDFSLAQSSYQQAVAYSQQIFATFDIILEKVKALSQRQEQIFR